MSVTPISNRAFRRLLLCLNGLAESWQGDPLPQPLEASDPNWICGMTERLGFVQVDPVSAIERAHHHILFSRNQRYTQAGLKRLLEEERTLFENWSHDAAIIPTIFYPYWRHYFQRAETFEAHPGYRRYFSPVTEKDQAHVLHRIEDEGPLRPRDIDSKRVDWDDDYFQKPSLAKITMEFLWRTGKLAISRRDGRQKVYDLSHRVIPPDIFGLEVSKEAYVDWACRQSLARLGAATPTQMAHFFDAISKEDALAWCEQRIDKDIDQIRVSSADGAQSKRPLYALASLLETIADIPEAPRRLRLLNPFDPLIHDRRRTRHVFGFDYTVEIWVPAKRRRYGYYVLPILEGERFTGRIDAKVNRKKNQLQVLGLWWEDGVRASPRRKRQLEQELDRLSRFAGVGEVIFLVS